MLRLVRCGQLVGRLAATAARRWQSSGGRPDVLYKQLELEMRSHDPQVLKSYDTFVKTAAAHLDIDVSHSETRPKPIFWRWCVLKSVHVHKKHKVQYEARTYIRLLTLRHLTGSTATTWLEYVQRNLPEGVGMRVRRRSIHVLPEHLRSIPVGTTS